MLIDSQEMLAAVGNDGIIKLDVRDVDEWTGLPFAAAAE